eukprot:CAMPEP_0178548358 /NCGR_PEP_ID=MMETSP0697-20121206/5158_1 /TAXON_ID=265572 /ORGANISM="Extubocellulus spinifer, Strain CCMP396" /LENGTH=61 /DNA_ID=CAMNT_0020181037 /DNA_START=1181 /DNA_END=1363 /DNA_ORIENTATION=+
MVHVRMPCTGVASLCLVPEKAESEDMDQGVRWEEGTVDGRGVERCGMVGRRSSVVGRRSSV